MVISLIDSLPLLSSLTLFEMLQPFSRTYAKQTKLSEDTVFFIFKMLNLLLL